MGPAIQAEQKPGLKGLLGSYADDDDEPSADAAVDQDQGNVLGQGEGAGTSAVAAGGDSSTAHSADKAEEIAAQAATTAPAEESSKLVLQSLQLCLRCGLS